MIEKRGGMKMTIYQEYFDKLIKIWQENDYYCDKNRGDEEISKSLQEIIASIAESKTSSEEIIREIININTELIKFKLRGFERVGLEGCIDNAFPFFVGIQANLYQTKKTLGRVLKVVAKNVGSQERKEIFKKLIQEEEGGCGLNNLIKMAYENEEEVILLNFFGVDILKAFLEVRE
ncbi:MAG: hypothetical protein ACOCUF_03985 [Patescibacteria group bacterium]